MKTPLPLNLFPIGVSKAMFFSGESVFLFSSLSVPQAGISLHDFSTTLSSSRFECYLLSLHRWLLTYQSRWLYAVLTIAFPPCSPFKAWSITYHSWLTFVLLIWSCTLWMIRNRRKYAMISSPFMVVYANLLLILQYIWSFELPEIKKVPGFLEKKDPGELASKVSD